MSTEVMSGYKLTEVGLIPEEWEVKRLGECLASTPRYGINAAAVPYSDRLPVYIRITDISTDGRFSPEKLVSVDNTQASNYYLLDGDIVLARTGASVGKSYKYDTSDGPLVFAGFLILIRPNPTKLVSGYISSYLSTKKYWDWVGLMSMRSGQPGINGKEYSQLPLPIPSISEQREISITLFEIDYLIKNLDKIIAKKRDIQQAVMQQLLTGQRRLPGFSGEWQMKILGEVCKITTGKKDVNEGNPSGQYPFFTCARDHTYSDHYSFDCEAILVAGNGEVGNLNYYFGKFEAYQRTYVLYEFYANTNYIWHALKFGLAASLGIGKIGSSIPYIKKSDLTNFELPLPAPEEQAAIAATISDMSAELSALEARREKARQLKQGMMQELLTGRIRLK
ncbi:restriction endonuclease subunit S (plasmid) [Pseudomonas sp. FeN3W]|uniref:restriction endonuclease subunit S n=1 Tax=Stutzerimonas frequens TaxID=2968969 RepID=UPI00190D07FB|nr:restriction endonuclease subunit S [Stutzerimonas frequens]MBK3760489.1 restriction endonuclease subunit S [Stutzerimonas frequens]WOF81804.1 restriction endonuclease subunit S [Pseudomonas sp. FeN3W]